MQIQINGLISGSAISLLALAFQSVYLPTRAFYLGLAGIYLATPFIAHAVLKSGGPIWLAALAGLAVAIILSLLCEWANHAPLARKRASEGARLIASLGVYIVLVQVIAMIWGNDTKTLRSGEMESLFRKSESYSGMSSKLAYDLC